MTKKIVKQNLITVLVFFVVVFFAPSISAMSVNNEKAKSINQKILVINFDPILEDRNNIKLHQLGSWWNDPKKLTSQYISDFKEVTNGYINYEIVNWIEVDEYPRAKSGFMYDDKTYLDTYDKAVKETKGAYWTSKRWHESKLGDFDYDYLMNKYNIIQAIQKGEIDEVWMFSGPCMGVGGYESQMVGKNAFWCNSPPIKRDDCKPFVIYGFSYERDVDCMLENAGHRMESIMSNVFGRWDYKTPLEKMNKWERFTLYDKVSPGNAGCGNVHYAPNSNSDYDWGNKNKVMTSYVDWLKYPQMTGEKVLVDSSAWGSGDMRLHHKWWFKCMPNTEGLDENGYYNNWWKYFAFPTERPKIDAPQSVKDAFKAAIDTATIKLTTIIEAKMVGSVAGNIPQSAKDDFQSIIDKAKAVKDREIVTQEEIDEQLIALEEATISFNHAVDKATAEKKKATIAFNYEENKAAAEKKIAKAVKDKEIADKAVIEAKSIISKVKTKTLKQAATTLLSAAQAAVDKAIAERALAKAELAKALTDKVLEEAKVDLELALTLTQEEDDNESLNITLEEAEENAVESNELVLEEKNIASKASIVEKQMSSEVKAAIKVLTKAGITIKNIKK